MNPGVTVDHVFLLSVESSPEEKKRNVVDDRDWSKVFENVRDKFPIIWITQEPLINSTEC